MKYLKILCNLKNYGPKRDLRKVKFIVIHYTAGSHDTAVNEGNYFKNNAVKASAHFFIDRDGNIVMSVPMDRIAWSVGGKKYADCARTGGGKKYGICTNANSVSIELCAIAENDPSEKQIRACKECVAYIMEHCTGVVGAMQIIRHFDVNGKHCPARMMDNHKWNSFKARIIKT